MRRARDRTTLIVRPDALFVVDHYEDADGNVLLSAGRLEQAHNILQRTGPNAVSVTKTRFGATGAITRTEARRRFGVQI